MIECDFLTEYTREDYNLLRKKYPEDGTEYSQWQKFPKLPEEGKVIITLSERADVQLEYDELVFRKPFYDNDNKEFTYLRHWYYFDTPFDVHYWKCAIPLPENYSYNVGD